MHGSLVPWPPAGLSRPPASTARAPVDVRPGLVSFRHGRADPGVRAGALGRGREARRRARRAGAAGFRGLLDGFPEPVGVLWAVRDPAGRIVDFTFGYGNPTMLRGFRIPAETPYRYTLLEALPAMRGSKAFGAYSEVCDTGRPFVNEVTYDTPFGDGYMLGTFLHRAAKLGDGVVVFLHDVSEERRMEAELKAYANVVAHDLSEPLAGISVLVTVLEQRPEEPPAAEVLHELRASTARGRELIEGVLAYARSGELAREHVALQDVMAEVAADLRAAFDEPVRLSWSVSYRRWTATRASCGASSRTSSATR